MSEDLFKLYTIATRQRPTLLVMITLLEYLNLKSEIVYVSEEEFHDLYEAILPEGDYTLCIVNNIRIRSVKELVHYFHKHNLWQNGAHKR